MTATHAPRPALFGLANSNKDFSLRDSWGKNQFNNAFPVALGAYMASKKLGAEYIKLDKRMKTSHVQIGFDEVFGMHPASRKAFFAFESIFSPYEKFIQGRLPRIDLVVKEVDKAETH